MIPDPETAFVSCSDVVVLVLKTGFGILNCTVKFT
jgi:hypothetical protein